MNSKKVLEITILIGFVIFLFSLFKSLSAMLQATDKVEFWLIIAVSGLLISGVSLVFYKL